ncbi:chloride channel protein [Caminibacter sp.]
MEEERKNYFKILQEIIQKQAKYIRFDIIMISHFFGRWIPYAMAIGIVTGSLAAFMDLLIVSINSFLSENLILILFYPLFVSMIVGLGIRGDKTIAGPGIGFAIRHLKSRSFIKFKSFISKLALSILTLSGGFIAGREGPSFYLGVALGEWLGRVYGIGKKYKNIMGLIGGGAFTGSLLKAPLGSSIFAMEIENMHDFDYRPFVPMIIAAVVSYLTFSFFRGTHPFILLYEKPTWTLQSIPYIIIMGLVISVIIYFYTFFYHTFAKFSKTIDAKKRPLIGTAISLPILIGLYLLIKDTDILSAPAHMGIISKIAQHPYPYYTDIAIIIGTIIITSFTLAFGIPGGLVLPNLLIGAAVGNMFGHYFNQEIVMFSLAGMGAALAAGAKTPLAAIVMITEMTHADVVIPMTAAVITSYTTSFGFSLYLGLEKGEHV